MMVRRIRPRVWLAIALGGLAAVIGAGWWYTFVAGAPQWDAAEIAPSKDLHFQSERFTSKAMGSTRTYGLILPPGYESQPNRRYPVILLLHGGHDNERAFFDKYAITATLDELYREGKLQPSIIITPDGNDLRGSSPLFDPDYFDGPNGKVGTLIGSELVSVVKERYRTRSEPGLWALGGFSSGGWGAINIGLRHLDNYRVLFSHDGYFIDASGPRNSPQIFIHSLPAARLKGVSFYLDVGSSDPSFLNSSRQFHRTLDQLGLFNAFHVFPGGHGLTGADYGWNYIRKHLKDSLTFVGRAFSAAERSRS
jgi:enterochelin esterase-like enzyme